MSRSRASDRARRVKMRKTRLLSSALSSSAASTPHASNLLAAEAQRVSGLRFEGFSAPLTIEDPLAEGEPPASAGSDRASAFTGGHVIEGNTFQDVVTFSIDLDADSTVTIRGNVFRNTHHAVAMADGTFTCWRTDISAPDPGRIPDSYPGVASRHPTRRRRHMPVCARGGEPHRRPHGGCRRGRFPQDPPGAVCSEITIEDNEIVMGPVPWPADSDRAGPLAIAPAIRLNNAQRAVIEGAIDWSERWMPDGGWPAKLAEGRVSNVLVEGNRISGAVGVAIELVYASHNRIIDNEIEVAPRVGVAGERRQRRPESAVIGQFIAARPAQ